VSSFTAIPEVPIVGVPSWEVQTLSALKENIELLLGIINKTDPSSQALLKRSFVLTDPGLPKITALTPVSVGSTSYTNISGTDVIITNTGDWNSIPTTLATCGYYEDLERIRAELLSIRSAIGLITIALQGANA
jgi:hypothetical protein